MTPQALAAIHARCFETPRPWSADEFTDLTASKFCFMSHSPDGFVLGRVIAGEAELLTIAVDPLAQRTGQGRALMEAYHRIAQEMGATDSFLEVSHENSPAQALYRRFGYEKLGTRKNYYTAPDGSKIDAVLMGMPINKA